MRKLFKVQHGSQRRAESRRKQGMKWFNRERIDIGGEERDGKTSGSELEWESCRCKGRCGHKFQ